MEKVSMQKQKRKKIKMLLSQWIRGRLNFLVK